MTPNPRQPDTAKLGPLGALPTEPAAIGGDWFNPNNPAPSAAQGDGRSGAKPGDQQAPVEGIPSPKADKAPSSREHPEMRSIQPAQVSAGDLATEHEYRLAKAIGRAPLLPSSQYALRANMSSKTAVRAREGLVAKGLVRERKKERAGRGGRSLLLELTAEGVRALHAYETAVPDLENLA